MAVLQMQRMSICALKKDRKAILEKIQSMVGRRRRFPPDGHCKCQKQF